MTDELRMTIAGAVFTWDSVDVAYRVAALNPHRTDEGMLEHVCPGCEGIALTKRTSRGEFRTRCRGCDIDFARTAALAAERGAKLIEPTCHRCRRVAAVDYLSGHETAGQFCEDCRVLVAEQIDRANGDDDYNRPGWVGRVLGAPAAARPAARPPRVTIAGVHRAYTTFGLDPAWRDPISLIHRCPACGAGAVTVAYAVGQFATYCDKCRISGPGGFEETARAAVKRHRETA